MCNCTPKYAKDIYVQKLETFRRGNGKQLLLIKFVEKV